MKRLLPFIIVTGLLLSACQTPEPNKSVSTNPLNETVVKQAIDSLQLRYPNLNTARAQKGIEQALIWWTDESGTTNDFINFCKENYVENDDQRFILFNRLSDAYETLLGGFNKISLNLKKPIHVGTTDILPIDQLLGGYDVSAHFTEDMFANKVAFITILNFPAYTLAEKTAMTGEWSRKEWAYARMGDMFTSLIPSDVQQNSSDVSALSEAYISNYNIMMGSVLNGDGKTLFPEGMKLISHWNLRDELKANYANKTNGLEKQELIYTVMQRIIHQDIPEMVINNDKVQWNPITNKVFDKGQEIEASPEPDTRYKFLLDNFIALDRESKYTPLYPTYIKRAFDGNMEMSKDDVERIFTEFVSSPVVKEVGTLIENRLGRKLRPFDIWYDGFKTRSNISDTELNRKTNAMFGGAEALQKGIPVILTKLGFSSYEAERIGSKIQVDASRSAGHAWGAAMKGEKAHLRSRMDANNMDYLGFNISMHELGHCVEQTISLYDIDYYILNGVPNTAFTEALAFIFQKRDLDILGMNQPDPNKAALQALDIFWGSYEIMGVSLVDMRVWEWMYANPNTTPAELKTNIIRIAGEVWNSYYAPVLGETDSPLLAIYSHMINYPLYLSNYPVGHIIEFQLEEHLKGKDFGAEVLRIFKQGTLTPQQWMKEAVGSEVSSQPLLKAASEAVAKLNKK